MKIVRRNAIVGLLSALALLCSPFTARAAQSSQRDQAALVQLERDAWDVAKQKNWQAYNRLLSQDFAWIDDSGVLLGREPFLKYIADLNLTDYAMEDVKVTMFNNNTAMLTQGNSAWEKRGSRYPANAIIYRLGIPSAWRSLGERFHADDCREAVIAIGTASTIL